MLKGGKGGGKLVGSVMKKVGKALKEPGNQKTITAMAQSATPPMVMQMASVAGMPMDVRMAGRVSAFAHGITEDRIIKTVAWAERIAKFVEVARKILKVVAKYKFVIVYLVLYKFIKRALGEVVVKGAVKGAN